MGLRAHFSGKWRCSALEGDNNARNLSKFDNFIMSRRKGEILYCNESLLTLIDAPGGLCLPVLWLKSPHTQRHMMDINYSVDLQLCSALTFVFCLINLGPKRHCWLCSCIVPWPELLRARSWFGFWFLALFFFEIRIQGCLS